MVLWVFGYGSLIWKAGIHYDERRVGYIKGYRRLFHQGSTDHRGTPANPGRTVTLEPADGEICDKSSTEPTLSGVLVYIASADKKLNKNYLGPAPLEVMAFQIIGAMGPSGSNVDYLFQLEAALLDLGCKDSHVTELAKAVRKALVDKDKNATSNGHVN